MPRATLTLTVPEGIWIGDVTRNHPEATVRILSALTGEDAGVGLAEITAPDLSEMVADIADDETVTELEILQRHEETVLVQFETTMPLLLLPVQDSGVPLTMPFTIRDGRVEWEITAPQHRLSELGAQLDQFGIPYTVEEVRQYVEPEHLLTERQLRLMRVAVERGYYDTPRRCSLTDLADHLDLAKSTCSETLHRAEGKVIKQFLEESDETTFDIARP